MANPLKSLDVSISRAAESLLADQREDGHWVYEFETDVWSSSDYVLLVHFLGETPDEELEQKIGRYLRRTQLPEGGWAMFKGGKMDASLSVKAYFALKMIGDLPDARHMVRARRAIHASGGAEGSNVFTRVLLALFGVVPWNAVPIMPVEIMLLPKWFPFHLSKVSWWARVIIVPLLVLCLKQPVARNPRRVLIDELFRCSPSTVGLPAREPHYNKGWFWFFRTMDCVLRFLDPLHPACFRQRGIDAAVRYVDERVNSEDGFGGFLFSTAYAIMMYDTLGYGADHPSRMLARSSIDKKLVFHNEEAYFQPLRSPVWDTSLAVHALFETSDPCGEVAARRGLHWLLPRQVLDLRGDWTSHRPNLQPGGWAFQYLNPHYPDVDDTAVIVMAMHRSDTLDGSATFVGSIARGREWVVGMQSSIGGWAAFEPENIHYYLDNIPFSDRGVLLDPPTADVTSRCLSMLSQLGVAPSERDVSKRAQRFLLKEQKSDGSWFGRWGINYINGTWSALCALNAAGVSHEDAVMRRAVEWLLSIQNEDGGWGEDASSYNLDYRGHEPAPSTSSQTSWALLGLMAAGEVNHPAVARGIQWLQETQCNHGAWKETRCTGVGFPNLLYIRYHGYPKYLPLWALARYRNLKRDNSTRVKFGL